MNNKILKKYKIDERYVLSERKFLYTFGYLCLEDELIKNGSMSKKQLYYFLEQRLEPACEEDVNLSNVATGQIILVGRGNNFRAYHRPIEMNNKKNEDVVIKDDNINYDFKRNIPSESYCNCDSSLSNMSLSNLIKIYHENEDCEDSVTYLEEILLRTRITNENSRLQLARKYKNKIKCYKKSLDLDIDK